MEKQDERSSNEGLAKAPGKNTIVCSEGIEENRDGQDLEKIETLSELVKAVARSSESLTECSQSFKENSERRVRFEEKVFGRRSKDYYEEVRRWDGGPAQKCNGCGMRHKSICGFRG